MDNRNKFCLKTARRETDTRAECYGDPELFKPWGEMSEAAKAEFQKNGPIPCEGSGMPGYWCEQCRFGQVDVPEDV